MPAPIMAPTPIMVPSTSPKVRLRVISSSGLSCVEAVIHNLPGTMCRQRHRLTTISREDARPDPPLAVVLPGLMKITTCEGQDEDDLSVGVTLEQGQ